MCCMMKNNEISVVVLDQSGGFIATCVGWGQN